jgi:tetratricopeptide (TPR) repeat protein
MHSARIRRALVMAAAAAAGLSVWLLVERSPRKIMVDYPLDGSMFPPEFPAPRFIWHDSSAQATVWRVEVNRDSEPPLRMTAAGERMPLGEIDPRCVAPTNELPKLTPQEATAHTWKPDPEAWAAIKKMATTRPVTLTISGYADGGLTRAVSRGRVTIQISKDPVGAPVFYRDVPLMPSETERGVIKPLAQQFTPLIAWRVRNVSEDHSRVVMTGIHSCANCHSVSRDGGTMAMDLDGPNNDKGLYAIFPIKQQAAIRNENVVAWSTFRGKLGGKLRVGFMSQISPNGKYVVTSINDPGEGQTEYQRRKNPKDLTANYYVANFTDYRFLQVFYLTRGILAWYSAETGKLQPLPGADDPRYVHTNAVWSPDGKYLVFARAEARDAYVPHAPLAVRANDPNETQIQYDLYRIPFNDGKGGQPEPLVGASRNGMSNSFPKISPDGRWIVFVQARNGQLMRPDSQLYIVPAAGGQARRLRANTPLMNSWHSFSPNGRWLVFSSKSRGPYTKMFLTHLDDEGTSTPAILIENATASNRAVNIPEFVNIPADGLLKIDAPVTEYYRLLDDASEYMKKDRYADAVAELRKALEMQPDGDQVHNSLGGALTAQGKVAEAIPHFRKAIEISPDFPDAHNNLANALAGTGNAGEAIAEFQKALELKPDFAEAYTGLGSLLARQGRMAEAIPNLQKAVEYNPDYVIARSNLALALSSAGRFEEATVQAEASAKLTNRQDPRILGLLEELYAKTGKPRP